MKKILVCLLAACTMFSCGSKKEQVSSGDNEIVLPCSGEEYESDKTAFRAWGEGYATDLSIARDKALLRARTELATQMNATIKRVVDDYSSSYQTGLDEESKSRYQGLTRMVVEQQLRGTREICKKAYNTKEGKIRVIVVVELASGDVLESLNNRIAEDDKLKIDYEYEKFKETFEKEFENMKK